METCISIVGLEAILVLTNRKLGATDSACDSPTSDSILRVLVGVAYICEILPIQCHLLHLICLAFELAREEGCP